MRNSSEEKLQAVHPELARRVRLVITQLATDGLDVRVVQGLRTFDEQDALYAQGRILQKPGPKVTNAKGGFSNHNFGLAVDLCPFLSDGNPNWNAPETTWKAIGKAAEAQGLEWGGRWKGFVDRPHVQLPGLSVSDCRALYRQGGLPLVWQRATAARKAVTGETATTHAVQPLRAAQSVTVTSVPQFSTPAITPQSSSPHLTAPVSNGGNATPARFPRFTYPLLKLASGLSLGSAAFWSQYKWPLICLGCLVLGLVIAWTWRPPFAERTSS